MSFEEDKAQEVFMPPCIICDEPVRLSFAEPTRSYLLKHNVCFSCYYWLEVLDAQNTEDERVIVNHHAYHIGLEEVSSAFHSRGYGGRPFAIQYTNRRVVRRTTNLWDNGDVPEYFWHMLPDNAEFINP